MSLGTRIRTALANRRTERLAQRRLAAELAEFQTPAERAELEQVLARHSAEEARPIWAILDRQDAERLHHAAFLSGYRV